MRVVKAAARAPHRLGAGASSGCACAAQVRGRGFKRLRVRRGLGRGRLTIVAAGLVGQAAAHAPRVGRLTIAAGLVGLESGGCTCAAGGGG